MSKVSAALVVIDWSSIVVVLLNIVAWAGIALVIYHFLNKRKWKTKHHK